MKKHQPSKTSPPRGSKGPEATKCRQVAALPWRRDAKGKLVVLLVTSRTNHKWMLPKGWPMPGKSDPETASIEAHEEAGVSGEVAGVAIGSYHYRKIFDEVRSSPAQAVVYALAVTAELDDWRERDQRRKKWVRPHKAATMVFERDLARLLSDIAERRVLLA